MKVIFENAERNTPVILLGDVKEMGWYRMDGSHTCEAVYYYVDPSSENMVRFSDRDGFSLRSAFGLRHTKVYKIKEPQSITINF